MDVEEEQLMPGVPYVCGGEFCDCGRRGAYALQVVFASDETWTRSPESRNGTSLLAVPVQTPLSADCGVTNEIKAKDPVQCRSCGYRILYKKRTKRLIQFEAR